MLQKFLTHGVADATSVQAEPFAIVFIELVHFARKNATLEPANDAILAIKLVEAFVADGRFEFVERHLGTAERVLIGNAKGEIDERVLKV